MNNKNIAILGGTFDPIHNGHLQIAEEVFTQLPFTEIKFIPNKIPPHKNQPFANTEQRLAMLKLALAEYTKLSPHPLIFNMDLCEINRNAKSYTIDTINYLKNLPAYNNTTIWLILGLDSFYSLPQWHQWQELLNNCNFIVITRELSESNLTQTPSWIKQYLSEKKINAKNFLELNINTNGSVVFLPIDPIAISATYIRELFQNYSLNKQTIAKLVPTSVIQYILDNDLYL
jgi:nicotinate-nucleotide adenylyltransferase